MKSARQGTVVRLLPRLSVIVPATDGPPTLDRCLSALSPLLEGGDELIVVREPPGAGPAEARNQGAEEAHGDVLVFVDADVEVHADSLDLIRRRFADDAGLAAVFGSYDDTPAAPGAVSNFRNLLHHHVHSSSAGRAQTFWAGLGAVRRHAFLEAGGFGAGRYPRPSVEDIELGLRLSGAGAAIELDPRIRGCHLKRWTLARMVSTDFTDRGIPWTRLLIDRREAPAVLNLGWRHRASSVAALAGAASVGLRRPVAAGVALAALLGLNAAFYRLLVRRRGAPEAALGIGLHVVHHLTAIASVPAGAALHLRRPTARAERPRTRDPRVARKPNARPVSHDPRRAARRSRAGDEVRIGLVGCGRLAERAYVAAAELAGGIRLSAVADPEPERCAVAAPGVPAFATAEALIAAGSVDALVVATPAHTHLGVARLAAAAGLPALVEKPPAADAAGSAALAALDPAPWLGFNRRFEPALAALARKVPGGEPLELSLSLAARRAAWRPHTPGDDVLLDLGPHLVDLARWLSGAEIERVRARMTGEVAWLEVDLGARGQATIECAGDRAWRERFDVRDTRGRTLAAYAAGGMRAHAARLRRPSAPHPLVHSLARQLEAFGHAVRSSAPPELATAADGVAAMAAIDAARVSARHGGTWIAHSGEAVGRRAIA